MFAGLIPTPAAGGTVTDMASIRVLIADDQMWIRTGLRVVLGSAPDIDVVAEAGDGREAVLLTTRHTPDVVLMDLKMPVLTGVDATREIMASASGARVLVLTTFGTDENVYGALRAGASGFLLKDAREEQLIDAVRVVAAGEAMLAPAITQRLIADFVRTDRAAPVPATAAVFASLTDREVDVVRQVAFGRSNAEIAVALFITVHTVKAHVARILGKLNLRDRTQIAVLAYEYGLVRPGEALTDGLARESDAPARTWPLRSLRGGLPDVSAT